MTRTASGRRLLSLALALMTMAALVGLAAPAQANHDNRQLEVVADYNLADVGGTQLLTATICRLTATSGGVCTPTADALDAIVIDFEIESGPGDTDGGGSVATPDLTCTIPVNQTTCTVSISSNTIGTTMVRAWIDHFAASDDVGATDSFEGDLTEGRISNPATDCSAPGEDPENCVAQDTSDTVNPGAGSAGPCSPPDGGEPDCTDVVRIDWTEGDAAILDCEPEVAVNPLTGTGSSETYTCTQTDQFGNPVDGIRVDAENLAGANDADNAAAAPADYRNTSDNFCQNTTGPSCSASISPSDGEAGSANICFWSDTDNDTEFATNGVAEDGGGCGESQGENDADTTDVVTKTWQARNATSGGLDAEPETDTNNTGDQHTITATVFDQFGGQFTGATVVNFEFFQGSPSDSDLNTPQTPDKTCTTNNAASCSVSYTSSTAGRDRVCVWTNSAPVMVGDNNTGTCDGESLNDADDTAGGDPDAPEPANDDVDVVEKIWNQPGQPTRLNCDPETATNPVDTSHTVTCTVTDASGGVVPGAKVDAEATGANDPDDANSPTSPDFTCTTQADNPLTPLDNEGGTCTFTHGTDGGVGSTSEGGLTTYRAWIDADDNNATTEADASEGRDETTTPGADAEPDDTDVVEKSWVAQPASVSISPKSDTASVGTCNPYTITVLNSENQPAQGAKLDVEQRHEESTDGQANDEPRVTFCTPTTGPNASAVDTSQGDLGPSSTEQDAETPDNLGTAGGETTKGTDSAGKITIGIQVAAANGDDGTGLVNLVVWFEDTDNDDPDNGEPQDTATKTWEPPLDARVIDCEPEAQQGETGTDETVTCTVTDRDGNPVANESVTFTSSGVGDIEGDGTENTNASGQVTVTATSDEAGDQTVTGTITDDTGSGEPAGEDECDKPANNPTSGDPAGVCADSVTITWAEEEAPQCSDGLDNDGDGDTDFPADEGCDSTTDDDETNVVVDEKCPGFENAPGNHVVGTEGDDVLVGTEGDDIICGLGGNDQIDGLGGSDLIQGGSGNDTIDGGDGADDISAQGGDDTVFGNEGNDEIVGGPGDDTLSGNGGKDVLLGGGGNDVLKGNAGNDFINGAGGNDSIRGGSGNDNLKGAKGNDNIKGGSGNDTINGGNGKDRCRGGAGKDKIKKCEGGSRATRRRHL